MRDVEYALGESRFAGRLIPVMVRHTKNFPWIFQHMTMLDFKNPAATSRKVAAMLRVTPDAEDSRKAS